MSEKNGPSNQDSDQANLTFHVVDQFNQDLVEATAKLTCMLEDLKGSAVPDPDQSRIVSDNLSPLAAGGQPTDKIYFPLAEEYYKDPSHSKRQWFWLRGSKVIECMPMGTERIRPLAARSRIILIPGVPHGTLGQQITYILILRATFSNNWADLTKIFNQIWNERDFVLAEYDPRYPQSWTKWLGIQPYPDLSKDKVRSLWRHQRIYQRDADSVLAALENLSSRTDFQCRFPSREGVIIAFDVTFDKLIKAIKHAAEAVEVELKATGEGESEVTHHTEVDEQKVENDQLGIDQIDIEFQKMTNIQSGVHDADIEPKQAMDTKPLLHIADAEPEGTEDGQPSINDTDSEPTIMGDTEPSSDSTDTETVDAKTFEPGPQNADTGSKQAELIELDARDSFTGAEQVDDSRPFTHVTDADYAQHEYAPLAMRRAGGVSAKVEFMPPFPLDSDADYPQVRGMRIGNFMLDNSDYD